MVKYTICGSAILQWRLVHYQNTRTWNAILWNMNNNLIKRVLPTFSDALQTKCVHWAAMTVNFHIYYWCHAVIPERHVARLHGKPCRRYRKLRIADHRPARSSVHHCIKKPVHWCERLPMHPHLLSLTPHTTQRSTVSAHRGRFPLTFRHRASSI